MRFLHSILFICSSYANFHKELVKIKSILMAVILAGSGQTPSLPLMWPKHETSLAPTIILARMNCGPFFLAF